MIPKIIHHSAPKDKDVWHPLWNQCLESWKKHFPEPEYKHIMWNDEDIDNLVKNEYNEYWFLYESFPLHIIKLDFARYAMLHLHGGIYADMDIFCYKNFYDELDNDTILVASKYEGETLQNSMMITSKHNEFMKFCMNDCLANYKPYEKTYDIQSYIHETSGSRQLSKCCEIWNKDIKVLEYERFNPSRFDPSENIITKHMLTGCWGKEHIRYVNSRISSKDMFSTYVEGSYLRNRGIDLKKFNFYEKYDKEK